MNAAFLASIVPFIYPAAILAFAFSLWRPQIGAYYLAIVLPMQTIRYQVFEYPLGSNLIDLVLLGMLIGIFFRGGETGFRKLKVLKIVLAVTAYSYFSLWYGTLIYGFWAPTTTANPRLSTWRNWGEFTILFLVTFAAVQTKKHIHALVVVLCITTLAINFDYWQVMSAKDLSHYSFDLRYSGVLGYADANGLAAFEAMFILFLFGLFSSKLSMTLKILIPPTLISCLYGLLFTFSRGAYLALAFGLLGFAVLRRKPYVGAVLVLLAVGSAILPSSVTDRIGGTYAEGSMSNTASLDSSATERIVIWESAVDLIKSHPAFGMGFNSYAWIHPYGYTDTHNLYLKILVEQGLIGFALFLYMLWKMFREGYKLFRTATDPFLSSLGLGFATCMLGAAFVNFFGDRWSFLQVDSYLWLTLAVVCRAQLLQPETAEEPAVVTRIEQFEPEVALNPDSLQPAHG